MNRYKKKVVFIPEAAKHILDYDHRAVLRVMRTTPDQVDKAPLDFAVLFGNDNPVEIEAGFGAGRYLIHHAARHPGINHLGIEITGKMVSHVANKAYKQNLCNVLLAKGDARLFIRHKVPDNSIARFHVYFPDPWVKKRQIKRRMITTDFLSDIFRVLCPGAAFNFFTDHLEYWQYGQELISAFGKFSKNGQMGDYIPTSYEEKWTQMGRPIYRAVLTKPKS